MCTGSYQTNIIPQKDPLAHGKGEMHVRRRQTPAAIPAAAAGGPTRLAAAARRALLSLLSGEPGLGVDHVDPQHAGPLDDILPLLGADGVADGDAVLAVLRHGSGLCHACRLHCPRHRRGRQDPTFRKINTQTATNEGKSTECEAL